MKLHVDRQMILRYARLSGDFNPIHVDPNYAAATELGGIIAHGTLSLNLLCQWIQSSLGSVDTHSYLVDVRFVAPVRENDTITVEGRDMKNGEWNIWAKNQDGATVIEGIAVATR